MRAKEFINEDDDREFGRKLDKYYRDRAAKAKATRAAKLPREPGKDIVSKTLDPIKHAWDKHGHKVKDVWDRFNRWQQADLKKSTLK